MFTSMASWRAASGVREVELHRSGSSGSESSTSSPPSSPASSRGEPCTPTSTSTAPSVRAKAAFFEALIRSNTPTLVRCAEGGAPEQELADLRGRLSPTPELSGDETDTSFSEVTMTLRLPRRRSNREREGPGSSSAASAEAARALQARLERVEAALARKTGECDNLSRVLKELSEGRVRATCARAVLAERHAELQAEFHRMQRVAELSREVSKENIAKTSKTTKALRQTQQELHILKKHAASLDDRNKKICAENLALREKIGLLERYDFEHVQQSACMRHYTRCRVAETY